MQEVLANVTNIRFEIEYALEQQLGALPLPFPGMDKSGAAICEFYIHSSCSKGSACPFRHVKGERTVVCKHWLRGLCKKGDQCEFLHEYDMSKMPECYFYSRFSACSNKECPFLHIDPESKIKDCPWYDRGFCRHGPNCRHRHTRRVMCIEYLCGFCPEGPTCKFMHPKFELPSLDVGQQLKKNNIVCHFCHEVGHKILQCPALPPDVREQQQQQMKQQIQQQQEMQQMRLHQEQTFKQAQLVKQQQRTIDPQGAGGEAAGGGPPGAAMDGKHGKTYRPLNQVTCFKCGEKGHYANKCPKGHLAFLSSALQQNSNPSGQQ